MVERVVKVTIYLCPLMEIKKDGAIPLPHHRSSCRGDNLLSRGVTSPLHISVQHAQKSIYNFCAKAGKLFSNCPITELPLSKLFPR
jgi:hypothetical protein